MNRLIKRIPLGITDSGVNLIEVTLSYNKGGMNYFTGRVEGRGYYLHVSPVRVQARGQYTTRTYQAFSGSKVLLEPCKRFSAKRMLGIEPDPELVDNLIQRVYGNV